MKQIYKLKKPVILTMCCLLIVSSGCATRTLNGGATATSELSEGDTEANRAAVISRLEKVGYSKQEAIARVDNMTGGEIDYFANHPESIKRTGIIILGGLISSSIYSSNQKKKINKEKEAIANERLKLEFDKGRQNAVPEGDQP